MRLLTINTGSSSLKAVQYSYEHLENMLEIANWHWSGNWSGA